MNRLSPRTLLFRPAPAGRDDETDRIVERYCAIRNIRQIAQEFGVFRATAGKHLADRGINTSRRMTPSEVERAVRLYLEGWSSVRIGGDLGFDNHTVLAALRSRDVTIRQPVAERAAVKVGRPEVTEGF